MFHFIPNHDNISKFLHMCSFILSEHWSMSGDKEFRMSRLMEQKKIEMIEAFLKLTPEERTAEAEKRLDETLDMMARMYGISPEDAYGKLLENSDRMH